MEQAFRSGLFGNLKKSHIVWGILLAFPALYINLGMLPLIGDESIRALVAIEMMLSGDYLTPTLNGALYFNKPPLYNWLLIGFFKLFSSNNEFIVRLPTTLFLLIYCSTIFWWVKKQQGNQLGILAALAFLTCGRILFWDSFLGLIDIAYSWLVFLNFMLIWHFYRKEKYTLLFLISYMLTSVGFLLKGTPTLAFQGITLLTLFAFRRNIRPLFSWAHAAGIVLFLLLTGSYYFLYHLENPEYLGTVLQRLVTESTQKSAIGTGISRTMLHIFTFPVELIYHFVPWTLLAVFLMHKKIFRRVFSNGFIRYCALVFLANLVVYWFSPVTYPRYLLMLMPLIFTVLLYAAKFHALANTPHYRIMKKLIPGLVAALVLASALLPVIFAPRIPVEHVYLKSLLVLLAGGLTMYFFHFSHSSKNVLLALGMALLISRISFNLFLVPYRQSESWATLCRKDALAIAHNTRGQELYLLTDTITIPNAYYLTRERNEILRFRETPSAGPYYIVSDTLQYGNAFKSEFSMRVPYRIRTFYAGKFKTDQP